MKLALVVSIILLAVSTGLRAEPPGTGDAEEGFVYAKEVALTVMRLFPMRPHPCKKPQRLMKSQSSRRGQQKA